ncbi:hypothetical protein B0H10DRAFT_2085714 [Mycena sp. CBHHK59/15]|nr:hypothetical protein B0H10DRAFT_2085714 [Mycena sp. CBHHK59/15]
MRPARSLVYFTAAFLFQPPAFAVLTNHTVDDTNPSVSYSNTLPNDRVGELVQCPTEGVLQGCYAPSDNPPGIDYTKLINGTMTMLVGTITVPFNGSAIYVFFATLDDTSCTLQIDGQEVGSFTHHSSVTDGSVLGYSNISLANAPHTLSITSFDNAMDFDGIIYSTGENPATAHTASSNSIKSSTSTPSQLSSSTSMPRASGSQSPASSSPGPDTKLVAAAAAGGVVGAIVLIGALLFVWCIYRRRRMRARRLDASVDAPFMGIGENSPSQSGARSDFVESRSTSRNQTGQLQMMQARIDHLQRLVLSGGIHPGSTAGLSEPPSYNAIVHDEPGVVVRVPHRPTKGS